MLVTDITKIKYYGDKNFKKNFKFRAFLKDLDIEDTELDEIVHELAAEIEKQIDCTACANCCIELEPEINAEDKKRISGFLGISEIEFEKQYLRKEDGDYYLNRRPCQFLVDKKCSIYEIRPMICKTYPNLSKNDFRSRLFQAIENYSTCPVVFNVFERLKIKLNFKEYLFPNVIEM